MVSNPNGKNFEYRLKVTAGLTEFTRGRLWGADSPDISIFNKVKAAGIACLCFKQSIHYVTTTLGHLKKSRASRHSFCTIETQHATLLLKNYSFDCFAELSQKLLLLLHT
ncbi:hypothetical protein QG37_02775 [Candidozyma auris]|nr:hypothetical protein QG37_02775 [[Candida] auris]